MDFVDFETNKRLFSGNFPDIEIYPAAITDFSQEDIESKTVEAFDTFKQFPDLFMAFIVWGRKRRGEFVSLNDINLYSSETNVLINTGYNSELLTPICSVYNEALKLVPFVTEMDMILWILIDNYYIQKKYDSERFTDKHHSAMCAFISLLYTVEMQETESGITIDVDRFIKEGGTVDDILYSWSSPDKQLYITLNDKEKESLQCLGKKRDILQKELQEYICKAKAVAFDTEREWDLFIKIINDLSKRESDAITTILEPVTRREKIDAIYSYKSVLNDIDRGVYWIEGSKHSLIPIFDAAYNRCHNAPSYFKVYSKREAPFLLSPSIIQIVILHATYNYLFISFHLFRMKQDNESAKAFFTQALSSIENNLGISEHSNALSIDESIEDFVNIVTSYYSKNEDVLNRVSYNTRLSDASIPDASLAKYDFSTLSMKQIFDEMHANDEIEEHEQKIEDFLLLRDKEMDSEQILSWREEEKRAELRNEQDIKANQLVKSLNIIYMFCESLRLMLNNNRINKKIKDTKKLEQYRKQLLLLDDRLVHKVYQNLDEQEVGMLEYREESGLIGGILSENENQEENFRNESFLSIFKNIVDDITTNIERKDIDRIFNAKQRVRKEILLYPQCAAKEQFADWLDEASDRIGRALVSFCKDKGYDEDKDIKESILNILGPNSVLLPNSIIDSLSTAELLYMRYASSDYDNIGFDFSCISALYYQAFEEAYNTLIWQKYSQYLNSLIIDDLPYTEILEKSRGIGIKNSNALGYLENDAKQRDYYIEYKSKMKNRPKTVVCSRCMFKSFAILFSNIHVNSKLVNFCEFFAKLVGYENQKEMFDDASFMQLCTEFSNKMDYSTDNRNNASHGGSKIDLKQCTKDRETVVREMKDNREESLGLIQLLLSIVKNDI